MIITDVAAVVALWLLLVSSRMSSNVVLIGQVKQYVACESQHQYDAFDMPDEIQLFLDEIHQ